LRAKFGTATRRNAFFIAASFWLVAFSGKTCFDLNRLKKCFPGFGIITRRTG
jgi:hypothetical protein